MRQKRTATPWKGPCSIFEANGFQELQGRVRRAARRVYPGRDDYEDVVQDMLTWIVEAQTQDPNYCNHHPSYQVKYAMRAAQDKRRPDRGQDVMRRSPLVWLDQASAADEASSLHEALAGAPAADEPILESEALLKRIEMIKRVRHAVQHELTQGQRAIVLKRFFHEGGLTTGQVAETLGVSKGTVCSQSRRAFDRIRDCLAQPIQQLVLF